MATPPGPTPPASPQRRWRAPCPGCGAAVEFRSAGDAFAVCSYCRSTVVREGESLRKIGVSAELFQDHTPLQLGAGGTFNGRAFTLVGRLQYGYGAGIAQSADPKAVEGSWNEWHALFSDGKSGWLCEDNDQYVFAFDMDRPAYVPAPGDLAPGKQLRVAGIKWLVASKVEAKLLAAAGELPAPPPLGRTFTIADLRSDTHRVATLDYADPAKPQFSIGLPTRLADLALKGVQDAEAAAASVAGRAFGCPNCGASVEVKLADTQSITCGNCASLIDVSRGIGAELSAVKQVRTFAPGIPLGRTGVLTIGEAIAKSWQVVGFAVKEGGFDHPDPEERFTWKEYLLYNREEGFAFLIDSQEGWTCYRTLTGTPTAAGAQGGMSWAGANFRLAESYASRVRYVEGEYYWKVDKGQRLDVQDYVGLGTRYRERLSRETSAQEVVWSWGATMPATVVAQAFKVPLPERIALGDVTPTSGSDVSTAQVVLWVIVVLFIMMAQSCSCDDDEEDCRSRGSSSSSFHK